MKRFLSIAAAIAALIFCFESSAIAQKSKDNTYDLQRAYEVLQKENDMDQALSLLKDQLKQTPDNPEAYLLRARIYRNQDKTGNALSDINEALKVNKPKKSGIANSTLHWWKATLYYEMEDFVSAAASYKKALELAKKDDKGNISSISFDYGQCLYDLKLYEESDRIYNAMIKADETDQGAMVGLARNMLEREEFEDAVACLNKAVSYGSDYGAPYRFLSQAYDRMGETDKAIDNILLFFEKDDDADMDIYTQVLLKHSTYAEARIKEFRNESEDRILWDVLMISLYANTGKYEQALRLYDQIEEMYGQDASIFYNRGELYDELGLYEKAIEQFTLAMEKDTDYELNCNAMIGSIYRETARYEQAREMYEKVIEETPSSAFGYYSLGWCWELEGNDEKAMEYYDRGIDLDKERPYIFLMRGELYDKMGKKALAKADFETILQLDTTVSNNSCRMYALHFLGRDQEAEEWMGKMIDNAPFHAGNYYDQACLLSRMGKGEESVTALSKAFEMGYVHMAHVEHDDDLDGIRDREDYIELMEKYRQKIAERVATLGEEFNHETEHVVSEIGISRRSGGTFEVPCQVNGLALNMIFDTGASDVTISSVEANFMLKNGHLGKDDIKGKRYYQIANGDISEGTVIVLREVKLGEAVLRNVEASVVKSQKAPLLLGQSVMEKFGTITIDNINSKLIIKQ